MSAFAVKAETSVSRETPIYVVDMMPFPDTLMAPSGPTLLVINIRE
jgi:hypothetical protein